MGMKAESMRRSMERTPRILLSDLISLNRKRAMITGAATGIGEAISYRFAGADLHLVDIDAEGLSIVRRCLSHFKTRTDTHTVQIFPTNGR